MPITNPAASAAPIGASRAGVKPCGSALRSRQRQETGVSRTAFSSRSGISLPNSSKGARNMCFSLSCLRTYSSQPGWRAINWTTRALSLGGSSPST